MAKLDSIPSFEKNGYMIIENVLSKAEIQSVLDVIADVVDKKTERLFQEGKIREKFTNLPIETRWAKVCEKSPQQSRAWNKEVFSPAIYNLFTNSKLLDICDRHLGSEITLNGDYFVRPKVPHEELTTLPWHQDSFYYGGSENDDVTYKILSFWIPLVDADEHNGCMQVIPQSHKWGLLPCKKTGDKIEPVENVEEKGEVVTARMKAGDVLIFNQYTMHRSLPNDSDGVRWSIDIRYTPTNQSFGWHKLNETGFEEKYTTLRVKSQEHPESVQNFEDWKAKRK